MEVAMNLHNIEIQTDGGREFSVPQKDYSIKTKDNIQVLFKNLEHHLIEHIEAADVVVGCVAWLTSEPILKALSEKSSVAIVVQKEDFLRPDIKAKPGWSNHLRTLYENLPDGLCRCDDVLKEFDTSLHELSCSGDLNVDAIRCVGNHNSEKNIVFPRSHHKFLLFCKTINTEHDLPVYPSWEPYRVWTGSYNLTKNAGMSFENAISLTNKQIIKAYFQEWAQIEALSEPLDWESDWCEPEWRTGT
jgi:hypothetical protein